MEKRGGVINQIYIYNGYFLNFVHAFPTNSCLQKTQNNVNRMID